MHALTGASRTGKTTLAKAVAEKLSFHYHDASVTKIMRECGIDGVADLPLDKRIELQEFLLDKFMEGIKAAPRPAITDRTPLDMIGYMLGELTMHNTPVEYHERIQAYFDKCIMQTILHFDMVLVLRPLPGYKVEEGKPPANRAYQTMVQMIIEGAVQYAGEYLHSGVLETTDLAERIESTCEAVVERLEYLAEAMKSVSVH